MEIKEALGVLDPADDEQWTAQGLPRVDVVSEFVGAAVTREDVTNASPEFNRDTAGGAGTAGADGDDLVVFPDEPQAEPEVGEGESVLKMAPALVLGSVALTQRALAEIAGEIAKVQAQKNKADESLKKMRDWSSILQRNLDRVTKSDPDAIHRQNIGGYLARVRSSNAARADRIKAIRDSGVDPREIIGALAGSKLDQAMGRKTGFGLKRPAPRPLKG